MPWKNKTDKIRARIRNVRRNKEFVLNIKKRRGCDYCGWNEHPEVLVFHHPRGTKGKRSVSFKTNQDYSLESIQKEINKCILLCPNCHEWLHFKEGRKFYNNPEGKVNNYHET